MILCRFFIYVFKWITSNLVTVYWKIDLVEGVGLLDCIFNGAGCVVYQIKLNNLRKDVELKFKNIFKIIVGVPDSLLWVRQRFFYF